MSEKAYLYLENGAVFEGRGFGAEGEIIGEVVFATGMTGYLETLTDNSYGGQIIVQTFPLIGNYGVIPDDFESGGVAARGYIVSQWCQEPSNFRSEGDIDAFLKKNKVVGIYGIDTRELTKIIRESGVMNGKITRTPQAGELSEIIGYRVENAVAAVSTKEKYEKKAENGEYRVALLDVGLKNNIVRELNKRGCDVTVFPYDTTAAEILAGGFDGVMLSNGPGDPAENIGVIAEIRKLLESGPPIFGICLGHQLLALAHGFETEKLKYGHRGANQPAKDLLTGRTYITSQNHGYAVVGASIDREKADEWFINVNDGTNEGVLYKDADAFSVQFHPEGCGGPRDTAFLFDKLIENMKAYKCSRKNGGEKNAAR